MEELVLTPFSKNLGPHPWRLQLLPDRACLVSAVDGSPLDIPRDRMEEMLHLTDFRGQSVLLIKAPRKAFQFKLTPEQRQQLEAWQGPPTEARLRSRLNHRLSSSVVLGGLFMFLATPLAADGFSPLLFVLGLGLLALGVLARFWPRPQLLLLDGGWMILASLGNFYQVLVEGRPWYYLAPLLILVPAIRGSFKDYSRFRNVQPDGTAPLNRAA